MCGKLCRTTIIAWFGLIAAVPLGPAAHAEGKPGTTKGVVVQAAQALALGPQIPQADGFQLRLRRIAIEPGGVLAHHNHGSRPTVVFMIEGEATEHRDGLAPIVRQAGDSWVEGKDLSHWVENTGGRAAVVFTADVVPVE